MANFYLATENGSEAMRVAAKAAAKDPSSAAVHRTLALVHRINFDLDLSADEYAKALELDPSSVASKRGLAEMKRAVGKSDEAVALYRELLAKNENDLPSQTGLILALFDAGNRTEAEAEMTRSLEKAPGNMILLAGAAYWYASKGFGDKAVELAQKAVAKEPRYVWSHIALGRGYMAQGKPVEAEQALIKARSFGNFPTLEYEIASARLAAGFFQEAVEGLEKNFSVTGSGTVKTNLGGRVMREEKSIADLAAFERKASIFSPLTDNAESAETLKALLAFNEKLQEATPNQDEILSAAQEFTKGTDKMRLHRQIYVASSLLQKRIAIPGVLELTKAAAASSDSALDVANPRSAVMASELYEARAAAFRKGEFLLVPDVPAQTLSAILRGRIEEIAGWALYQQNNFPAAIIRLRRAKGILPAKSAWWRSSVWRLGATLAANGDDAEALNMYIESYKTDRPDFAKYSIVEALYKKINGSTEGLEAKIGAERVAATSSPQPVEAAPTPSPGVVVPIADPPATTDPVKETPTTDVSKPVEEKPKIVETKVEPEPKTERRAAETAAPEKQEPKVEPIVTNSPSAVETKVPIEPKTELPQPKEITAPEKQQTKIEPDTKAAPPQTSEPVEEKKHDPKTEPDTKSAPPQSNEPIPSEKQEAKTEPAPKTEPAIDKTEEPKAPPQTEPVVEKKEEPKIDSTPTVPDKNRPAVSDPKTEPESSSIVTAEQSPKPLNKSASAKTSTRKTPLKTVTATAKTDVTKPLFEPIIISIPPPTPASRALLEGSERPRVIAGEEAKSEILQPCEVKVSQENISLINDGGTVGLLVTVEAPGDVKNLTATSSSSKDIGVMIEPEIGGVSDSRFFVIKSTSSSLGAYTLTFSAQCGKKDVVVTVR
jgi:tetratricopeptide (TPR) repeat protein